LFAYGAIFSSRTPFTPHSPDEAAICCGSVGIQV
jgi:hypothetical protein